MACILGACAFHGLTHGVGGLLCKLVSVPWTPFIGTTDSDYSARCLLFVLQLCTTVAAGIANQYFEGLHEHMAYRIEAAGATVFLALAAMAVSGCGHIPTRFCPILKVCLLGALAAFFIMRVPHETFDFQIFGYAANFLAFLFLIVQAIILLDRSTAANDALFAHGLRARAGGDFDANPWPTRILMLCVAVLALAIMGAQLISRSYPVIHWMVAPVMVCSMLLLLLSITEWSKSGNLLCSCVMTLYAVWLTYDTLIVSPDLTPASRKQLLQWPGVVLAMFSMRFSIDIEDEAPTGEKQPLRVIEEGEKEGERELPAPSIDTTSYAIHCLAHATACFYVASELVPMQSRVYFSARVFALVCSQLLWAWFLAAPHMVPEQPREFSSRVPLRRRRLADR